MQYGIYIAVIGWCGCSYVYVCCFTKPVPALHVIACYMCMTFHFHFLIHVLLCVLVCLSMKL